jgi:glycosyltransferase involved in cell wall biosynthesis
LKQNVLHLIDSFEQGGTERQAVQLVRMLHASGRYGVRLACLDARGMLRAEVEGLSLGEIPEFPLNSFYDRNALGQLRRFVRLLRESDISVVHAHGFYTNMFGVAGGALARTPARIASRRETEGFRTPAQKRVERQLFRLADRVVANAEAIRRALIDDEGVPSAKVVTLYNGLDMARVAPRRGLGRTEALAEFNLPHARRFVTIVANVNHPVKDHPMFLRAARRVRDAVPDAAFVIAGEGKLLESYRDMAASLRLDGDVFFTGRCERVADLLSVSDVCVLSSKAEGFSNSILEYMAAARPVVATDVGGAREALTEGETGYLVASGDDAALAARVTLLLREPERARQMGERGRRVVEQKFSAEAQLERVETLYDELLSRPASGREKYKHEWAG